MQWKLHCWEIWKIDAKRHQFVHVPATNFYQVIELEILLDEAREQYQTLLNQVKSSNSKTLQQKCAFLQRNLEQLTTVQQQVIARNECLMIQAGERKQ